MKMWISLHSLPTGKLTYSFRRTSASRWRRSFMTSVCRFRISPLSSHSSSKPSKPEMPSLSSRVVGGIRISSHAISTAPPWSLPSQRGKTTLTLLRWSESRPCSERRIWMSKTSSKCFWRTTCISWRSRWSDKLPRWFRTDSNAIRWSGHGSPLS